VYSKPFAKILPDLKTQFTGLKKGFDYVVEDAKLNIDTSPTRGGVELPRNRKVFELAWLNKVNNWLSNALQLGDRPFLFHSYVENIRTNNDLDVKNLIAGQSLSLSDLKCS